MIHFTCKDTFFSEGSQKASGILSTEKYPKLQASTDLQVKQYFTHAKLDSGYDIIIIQFNDS